MPQLSGPTFEVESVVAEVRTLRKWFRWGYTTLLILIACTTPFIPQLSTLPMWYLVIVPLAVLLGLHVGYHLYGDTGAGIGVGITSIGFVISSSILGDGFATQPVGIYMFPMLVGLFAGPRVTMATMTTVLVVLSGLYVWRYVLGFEASVAFHLPNWRLFSFAYLIYVHCYTVIMFPLMERVADAPMYGQLAVIEANRISDETRQATAHARDALASYSHEVRTPLNVIHAMADALLRTGELLSDHHSTQIRMLHSCAQNLLVISNNVLDISAIWANALTIHEGNFKIQSVLNDWVTVAKETAQRCSVNVSYTFENETGGLAAYASFDEGRVKQILYNVFDYALRRANENTELVISAKVKQAADNKVELQVTVTDHRDILSQKFISRMFTLPYDGSETTTGPAHSINLGMYVARKLSKALRGTVECEFSESKGVVYTFTLPLTLVSPDKLDTKPLCILYAEDEPANQFVMRVLLKGTGFVLELADDGQKALEMFRANPSKYDTVLLDVNMPVMGGKAAAKAIRALESSLLLPRVPIAFISAAPVNQLDLIECEVDCMLTKPCSKVQLLGYFENVARMSMPSSPNEYMQPTGSSQQKIEFALAKLVEQQQRVNKQPATRGPNSPTLPQQSLKFTPRMSAVSSVDDAALVSVQLPQSICNFFHSMRHPDIPILLMSKYDGSVLTALFAIWGCLFRLLFLDGTVTEVLLTFFSFSLYPLLIRLQSRYFSVSVYASLHTTLYLIWRAFSESGYDTFYLHSTYLLGTMLVAGTHKVVLVLTAIVHCCLGAALIYLHSHGLYVFPHQYEETTLAFQLLCYWSGATMLNALHTIYMDYNGKRSYEQLVSENENLRKKQLKTKRQQHAMLELSTSVTYDIRTPLNVVLGITDRLKEAPDLPDSMRQSAGVLDTAAGMLLLLLDNAVDAKRVDSGDPLPVQMNKVSLAKLGSRISTMMAFYARGRRLRLLLRIGQSVPAWVISDELRLQQVIVNLLTNAIKFTRVGSITLSIENVSVLNDPVVETDAISAAVSQLTLNADSGEEMDSSTMGSRTSTGDVTPQQQISGGNSGRMSPIVQQPAIKPLGAIQPADVKKPARKSGSSSRTVDVRFTVTDTGVGIGSKAVSKLFLPYYADPSSATPGHRSSGLGLYTSRAIVAKLGGSLNVTSSLGVGTSFFFTLPMHVARHHSSSHHPNDRNDNMSNAASTVFEKNVVAPGSLVPPTTAVDESIPPLRILFVEDSLEMQYIVKLFLSDTPHTIEVVGTATDAFFLFQCASIYDLVLLDQHLPDMEGSEAAKRFRSFQQKGQRAVIAAVTADTSEAARNKAIGGGCDYFLPKPLSRPALMRLLRDATETLSERDRIRDAESPFSEPSHVSDTEFRRSPSTFANSPSSDSGVSDRSGRQPHKPSSFSERLYTPVKVPRPLPANMSPTSPMGTGSLTIPSCFREFRELMPQTERRARAMTQLPDVSHPNTNPNPETPRKIERSRSRDSDTRKRRGRKQEKQREADAVKMLESLQKLQESQSDSSATEHQRYRAPNPIPTGKQSSPHHGSRSNAVRALPMETVTVPGGLYDYLLTEWLPRLKGDLSQMRALLDRGYVKAMRQVAHRIKGSAATFGLIRVGELCKTLMVVDGSQARPFLEECIESLERSKFIRGAEDPSPLS